jgi:branched-chain amino acid transport system substrate-binding protein
VMSMRRTSVVVLLVALFGATACAGDVVKYHDAAVGPDGVTLLAGGAPANDAGGEAGPAPGVTAGVAVPDTTATATTETTTGAMTGAAGGAGNPSPGQASPGQPVTTQVSGPTARSQQAAGVPPGATSGTARAADGSGGSFASTTPNGGGSSSAQSGTSNAGGSGAVPGAAPVPGGGTTTGVTKDTITVGMFYPKTGAYTGLARNIPAVTQAAFDEAGPINGRRVIVKFYDDGTANASTIQLEEKRAKDEVFILQSLVSESNVVLAPLAEQHKVPVVIGNIDEKVALPLTYSFPVFAFWARQAKILPSFIQNVLNAGEKKIGIVYEGTSTAIDAKNAFKDKAKELGLKVTFEQPIAMNQSTCANEVSNLQSRGIELVYMMNGPLGGICMLRDARALGYKPLWTGVGVSWGFNVVAQASGGGADGIRILSSTTTLETAAGRHYAELMRKAAPNSGADSDDVQMLWYDLLQTTIEAMRRTGPNPTREAFIETMETKMNGYDSGYLPPPTFGRGIRYGPTSVGVSACCTDGRWTTVQGGWRAAF